MTSARMKFRALFLTVAVMFTVAAAQDVVNAQAPVIVALSESVTLAAGSEYKLFVEAVVEDGGTLSYLWVINDRPMPHYTDDFLLMTGIGSTAHCYVIVTNTIEDNGDGGEKSVSTTSDIITLTVIPVIVVHAAEPLITAEPKSVFVEEEGGEAILSVTAVSPDGGTLSYQWYDAICYNPNLWIPVDGATEATFAPNTDRAGMFYYAVAVMNTNTAATGIQEMWKASRIAVVSVNTTIPIEISERAQNFFAKKDRDTLTTYQASVNPLQAERFDNVAAALTNRGIVFPDTVTIDGILSYRDEAKSRYFVFDSDNSIVAYNNNRMESLTDNDRSDTTRLRQLADELLIEILGEESENFKFYINSYEYSHDFGTGERWLSAITYRYVRLMDERWILGISNYVQLTLGKDGIPGQIEVVDPVHIQKGRVGKAISIESTPKYLRQAILEKVRPLYCIESPLKSIIVLNATESYLAIQTGDENILVPHVAFFTELTFENGESVPHEVNVPADIRFIDNVDPDDIIELPSSIKAIDRIIPENTTNTETAIIPPAKTLTAEFTAGPNPVSRRAGTVNFYHQGSSIKSGQLTVYNASGNVINKIKVSDMAPGGQSRRQIGSWNLADRKGRQVSEGTYLVKGTLTMSDGKKEGVSVMVGIR